MPVSIDSCPGCQAAVLPDTVACPACGHILKNDNSTTRSEIDANVVGGLVAAEMEDACRKCGQMVRSGLLRCWNCNEFMRKDIAERFRQLQSAPQKIVYSETDKEEYLPPRLGAEPTPQQTFTASDADFDVDGGVPAIEDLSKSGEFTLGSAQLADAPPAAAPPAAPAGPALNESSGSFDLASDSEVVPPPAPQTPAQAPDTPDDSASAEETKPAEAPADGDEKSVGDAAEEGPTVTEGAPAGGAAEDEATTAEIPPPAIPIPGEEDLFAVAMAEQKEEAARRKTRRKERRAKRNGILVYCPRGHRIEVSMKFAGKRGKCPKCKAPFSVPRPTEEKPAEEAPAEKKVTVPWLWDVKMHEVDPATLKLKPDSLVKSFSEMDLFFDKDKLHITRLVATKKGRNASAKQKDKAREGVREHLENNLALKDLPVGDNEVLKNEDMSIVVVVQPTLMPHESIFAGVPVFGDGRIAVRLSPTEDNKLRFLSFGLAKFRQFAKHIREIDGMHDFGDAVGIPMSEEFETAKCHYSDDEVKSLADLNYYQADPTFVLELVGRKCAQCGIVVSENYRKKEKLGGASGRGIAKAKCPKCTGKFGNTSLFSMQVPEPEETEDDAETGNEDPAVAAAAAAGSDADANKPETLIDSGFDMNDMDGAIARARSESDAFIEQLTSGTGENFGVKAPVEEDGNVEHFWLNQIVYSDGQFEGVIANDPGIVTNVKLGQKWTVAREEISDWQFMRDGKMHGNYTMRPLLATMPADEAEKFRSMLANP